MCAVMDSSCPKEAWKHGGAWGSLGKHEGAWGSMGKHGGAWGSMGEHGDQEPPLMSRLNGMILVLLCLARSPSGTHTQSQFDQGLKILL